MKTEGWAHWGLVVGLSVLGVLPAMAERKVAFVVGIDRYEFLPPLQKAANDARAVTAAIKDLGFDVVGGENLSRREMNRKFSDFETSLQPGDAAFFFFAGHGVAIGADNFILPADMPEPRDGEDGLVRDEGYSVDALIRRVQARGARTSFFILDACRNNPFAARGVRSIGSNRGLTRIEAPQGVFTLYSAGLGQAALDRLSEADPDPNSIFTRRLVPLLRTPGLTHVELAKRLQSEVDALARTVSHEQQPAYYDQIVGNFVFLPGGQAQDIATAPPPGRPDPEPAATPEPPADPKLEEAERAWDVTKDATSEAVFEVFVRRYKGTPYAAFATARLGELRKQKNEAAKRSAATTPPQTPARPRAHASRPKADFCADAGHGRTYCVSSMLDPQHGSSYGPENLFDGDPGAAWVEGRAGHGVGEWLVVDFGRKRRVASIEIRNGYEKSEDIFLKNQRVRSGELIFSGGERRVQTLEDELGPQVIRIDPAIEAEWVQFRITAVIPGDRYTDTAISEFTIDTR